MYRYIYSFMNTDAYTHVYIYICIYGKTVTVPQGILFIGFG